MYFLNLQGKGVQEESKVNMAQQSRRLKSLICYSLRIVSSDSLCNNILEMSWYADARCNQGIPILITSILMLYFWCLNRLVLSVVNYKQHVNVADALYKIKDAFQTYFNWKSILYPNSYLAAQIVLRSEWRPSSKLNILRRRVGNNVAGKVVDRICRKPHAGGR